MMQQGLVQVYTGQGKGKTTAALGLALRALGHGRRVLLVRMLKPLEPASGEVIALERFDSAEILTAGVGVIHGSADPQQVSESVRQVFVQARATIMAGDIDLAIFDEAHGALRRGALEAKQLLELVAQRPAHVELVFTGRHAPQELLEVADLVTEMLAQKHPYRQGIKARQGIEY